LKVLFLVPYPSEGPSNRFRVEQYLPLLAEAGIKFDVKPFFSIAFYRILYRKGKFFKKIFFFFLLTFRRIADLALAAKYDLVFVHREAYPFTCILEKFFRYLTKKMIYDFDDALFLPNVSDSNKLIGFLKNTSKPVEMIKMSNTVIAGNNFLKDFAARFNKNVSVIPTPIDTVKFSPAGGKAAGRNVVIGWIGSATTVKYLDLLSDVAQALLKKYLNLEFLIIGGTWDKVRSQRITCRPWSLEAEVSDLRSFDIGIMPLTDDDWSRGKCAFKLIEYMSVGIPVVASAVGMNKEVVSDGVNGFLASHENEWIDKLSALIENRDLRLRIGSDARRTIEKEYSLKTWGPKFIQLLHDTLRS